MPLTATQTFKPEVVVKVSKIAAVNVQAQGPGEISGPGLAVTVSIQNGTNAAIDLGNTLVDLTDSNGDPTIPIGSGSKPIMGSVAPGKTATGVYQFKIPADLRNPISIAVSYTTDAPVVVFSGSAG